VTKQMLMTSTAILRFIMEVS